MYDLKSFSIYTSLLVYIFYDHKKKSYFFNVGFETFQYIYFMLIKKK